MKLMVIRLTCEMEIKDMVTWLTSVTVMHEDTQVDKTSVSLTLEDVPVINAEEMFQSLTLRRCSSH